MAPIPIAAFCVETGSRRRCARMFIPLLIHAPPTAPERCLPPVRYQIANPFTELSVQFPSQGFIPSGGGGVTVQKCCPVEEHCAMAETFTKLFCHHVSHRDEVDKTDE